MLKKIEESVKIYTRSLLVLVEIKDCNFINGKTEKKRKHHTQLGLKSQS